MAAKLVRRTGFGASGAAVDQVVSMGAAAYVQQLLATDPMSDPGVAATPLPTFPDPGSDSQVHSDQIQALMRWWIRRIVAVQNPFGEKLTWVWHNYFATNCWSVWYAQALALQNQRFRTLGRGDFRTLAYSMLTDAAMIRFLSGESNVKGAANENLAREFMELFTLGHGGGYTEKDVREGARALTGWQINQTDWSTSVNPYRFDSGTKTFLGVTGNLDATGYCNAVLAMPNSPAHVASRLWSFLVSNNPPDSATVNALTAGYGAGRNLTSLLQAMLTCTGFGNALGTMVASDFEWLIGAIRTLKLPVADDTAAQEVLNWCWWMGQVPFNPPSVGGWPRGQLWLTSYWNFIRLCLAGTLAGRADLSSITGTTSSRLDAAAYLLGIASWSNSTLAALKPIAGNAQQLVTAALLSPENMVD